MSVFDLSKELLKVLVKFRENAPTDQAMDAGALRDELLEIFREMDLTAKSDVSIAPVYDTVREALAIFTDGMILESGWLWARVWQGQGIERYLYGRESGGKRFLELAGDLDRQPDDVAAIFYVCLALGYTGGLSVDAPELLALKKTLALRLPAGGPGGSPYHQPRPGAPPLPKPGNAGLAELAPLPPKKEEPKSEVPGQERPWWANRTAWLGAGLALALLIGSSLWLGLSPKAPAPLEPPVPAGQATAASSAEDANPPETTAPTVSGAASKADSPLVASSPEPRTKTEKKPPPKSEEKQKPPRMVWGGVVQEKPSAPASPLALKKEEKAEKPGAQKAGKQKPALQAAKKKPEPENKQSTAKKPDAKPASGGGASWQLQAGVFVGPVQSGRLAKNLTEAGLEARVEKKQRSGGKHWYVVLVGPLKDQDRVLEISAIMQKQFKIKPIVQKLEP